MINIVVTSKPVDGLFYYSYEYCDLLNRAGIRAQIILIRHRKYSHYDYLRAISRKYKVTRHLCFDRYYNFKPDDVTLILGRSMMTLSYQDFNSYGIDEQITLKTAFGGKVISVYSENHPAQYPKAVEF
jgi:hypothetical protein